MKGKIFAFILSFAILIVFSSLVLSESEIYDRCEFGGGWSEPESAAQKCGWPPQPGNYVHDCCCCYLTAHVHDLGTILPPGEIEIEYTPGFYQGCTSPMYVYYSVDGESWIQFYSTTVTQETWDPKTTYTETIYVPGDFRYVKIEIPNCYNDYSSARYLNQISPTTTTTTSTSTIPENCEFIELTPDYGKDTTNYPYNIHELTQEELEKVETSDDNSYRTQGYWGYSYNSNRYLLFDFPEADSVGTVESSELEFEWRTGCSNIHYARILVWDEDQGTWVEENLPDPPTYDRLDKLDLTDYINTWGDVNNFKIKFQAHDGGNPGYTYHDLVKLKVLRCVECTSDDDCDYLDKDYCRENKVIHEEGVCENYVCVVERAVEDCDSYDNTYCDGTLIKQDDGYCENAECKINTSVVEDCNDGEYCNGQETCEEVNGTPTCVSGTPVDCSENNILVNECFYDPDGIDFTWDYYSFISTCDEVNDKCIQAPENWKELITHTCSIESCGAECESDDDCEPNSCSETYEDYCDGHKLVEYDNDKVKDSTTVSDSCENTCQNDCTCTNCEVDCSPPETNSYCVAGVCGAECDSDDDCESGVCGSDCMCQEACEITLDSYSCEYDQNSGKWIVTATASWSGGDHAHLVIDCDIDGPYFYSPFTRSKEFSQPGNYSIRGMVHDSEHNILCQTDLVYVYCNPEDSSTTTTTTTTTTAESTTTTSTTTTIEEDSDGDGVPDSEDNCPNVANPEQEDLDGDGIGDACDTYPADYDNDGANMTEDCNDTNPNVHPGATEVCDNGIDDDCDGYVDTEDPDCITTTTSTTSTTTSTSTTIHIGGGGGVALPVKHVPKSKCGNGKCERGEEYCTCPEDCEPKLKCGTCEKNACVLRCPTCTYKEEVCQKVENCCGNGECEENETYESCPEDCEKPLPPPTEETKEEVNLKSDTLQVEVKGEGEKMPTGLFITSPAVIGGVIIIILCILGYIAWKKNLFVKIKDKLKTQEVPQSDSESPEA